jgi:3-hydroxyisobutyrate dehydrogenase-like beta-hydroxyacid dehydrogenase
MESSQAANVGFIGLGDIGAPMARRIADAGWPLHVWARRPETIARLGARPVAHASPRSLAAECAVVCLCVGDAADVEDVAVHAGLIDALRPGSVLVVHSSILPGDLLRLAARAGERGVHVVDAPISGGPAAAASGNLTTMVGGDLETFERVRPVLQCFSTSVQHVGDVGAGLTAKLINNVLCVANLGLARQALQVGGELGLDTGVLHDILRTSSGGSFALTVLPAITRPDTAPHALALLRKDTELFGELIADQHGPPSRLLGAARTALDDDLEPAVAPPDAT